MAHLPEITAKTFQREVLESELPVLVDLYATWCPPCKMMGTILEKVAPQVAGRAKIVKINVDKEPELAETFGVLGVPTLALVHHGETVGGHVGLMSGSGILQMIEKAMPAPSETARK